MYSLHLKDSRQHAIIIRCINEQSDYIYLDIVLFNTGVTML